VRRVVFGCGDEELAGCVQRARRPAETVLHGA
jgi:hypothetical protein